MKELTISEMKRVSAGGISLLGWSVISAAVSFVVGILDGIARPIGCR